MDGYSQNAETKMKATCGFLAFCAGVPRPVPQRRNAPNVSGPEAEFSSHDVVDDPGDLAGSHAFLWGWDLAHTLAYFRACVRLGQVAVVDEYGQEGMAWRLPREVVPFADMLNDLDSMSEWLAVAYEEQPTTSEDLRAASQVGYFEAGWEAIGEYAGALTGGYLNPMDAGGVEDNMLAVGAVAADAVMDLLGLEDMF